LFGSDFLAVPRSWRYPLAASSWGGPRAREGLDGNELHARGGHSGAERKGAEDPGKGMVEGREDGDNLMNGLELG
jgi:hypothetical protein